MTFIHLFEVISWIDDHVLSMSDIFSLCNHTWYDYYYCSYVTQNYEKPCSCLSVSCYSI